MRGGGRGGNQQWAEIAEIPVIAVMFCQAEEVYMFHTRHNPDYFCFTQLKYKEDYNKNVKGKWCETPYFDIATARVAMENLSEVTAYAAQAQLKLLCIFFYMSAHIYTVLLSTCRENTHSVGRTQKTIFISCKQTHLFMTRIRRPALLPVR